MINAKTENTREIAMKVIAADRRECLVHSCRHCTRNPHFTLAGLPKLQVMQYSLAIVAMLWPLLLLRAIILASCHGDDENVRHQHRAIPGLRTTDRLTVYSLNPYDPFRERLNAHGIGECRVLGKVTHRSPKM
jgi:hypothetical protein